MALNKKPETPEDEKIRAQAEIIAVLRDVLERYGGLYNRLDGRLPDDVYWALIYTRLAFYNRNAAPGATLPAVLTMQ